MWSRGETPEFTNQHFLGVMITKTDGFEALPALFGRDGKYTSDLIISKSICNKRAASPLSHKPSIENS